MEAQVNVNNAAAFNEKMNDITECKEFVDKNDTLLWQGSAGSGDTISVANIQNYSLFRIEIDGLWSSILAVKNNGSTIRGTAGNAELVAKRYLYFFSGTVSGNDLNIVSCTGLRSDDDGCVPSGGERNINKIYGVI